VSLKQKVTGGFHDDRAFSRAITATAWLLVLGYAGHGLKDAWQQRRQYAGQHPVVAPVLRCGGLARRRLFIIAIAAIAPFICRPPRPPAVRIRRGTTVRCVWPTTGADWNGARAEPDAGKAGNTQPSHAGSGQGAGRTPAPDYDRHIPALLPPRRRHATVRAGLVSDRVDEQDRHLAETARKRRAYERGVFASISVMKLDRDTKSAFGPPRLRDHLHPRRESAMG
jgi:hypothetical protein